MCDLLCSLKIARADNPDRHQREGRKRGRELWRHYLWPYTSNSITHYLCLCFPSHSNAFIYLFFSALYFYYDVGWLPWSHSFSLSFASPFFFAISLHWVKPLWRLGFWQWWVWCLRSELTHSQIYAHTYIRRPRIDVSWWKSALTCSFGVMQCFLYVNHIVTLHFLLIIDG